MELEDVAMNGSDIEKNAKECRRTMKKKIANLKRLVNIDPWKDEDSLDVYEILENGTNLLKFLKEPMVKKQFKNSSDYKKAYNGIVDFVTSVGNIRNESLLKKI